ncbi:MAG: GNAT family N-acetyltransferase [Deltaproteobacteria bacterium]|nr:GNAT family N-acetyltransferase [Deltaproteobacteria bacterium]
MAISIRKATAEDTREMARVHVDTWRSTYAGIVPQDFLDGLNYEDRAAMWARILKENRPHWHVVVAVTETGRIVGFSSGGKNRTEGTPFEGEVYAIYVDKEYQGQGIGAQLFQRSLEELRSKNLKTAMVWSLDANPYRTFYESMGGKAVLERDQNVGGKHLPETAYGWGDLSAAGRLDA